MTLSDKVPQVSDHSHHIKKSSNYLDVTGVNMRGNLLICGSLLQSITFLLCIQLQQTSGCMSAAKEDSFRAHRTVVPWTHKLAKPVSDGVSPVVPCPQTLARALKFVHVGWNRWKMHPLRTDLSKTKAKSIFQLSKFPSPVYCKTAKNICVCQKEMETRDGREQVDP